MLAADARTKMKELAIVQFNQYLKELSRGHYNVSYQPIMHKILFIESFVGLDKLDSIYDKLLEV
jgi:hypothetical protein